MASVYSVEVPGTEDPDGGWGPAHRSVDGQERSLSLGDTSETVLTCYENFQSSVRAHASSPCMGYRPIGPDGVAGDYIWSTYGEIGQRVDNLGAGLVKLGLCPPTNDPELLGRGILGLYSKNRMEWVIAEQAAFTQAYVTVPMYDTLGPESVAYVINQTSMQTLVCEAAEMANIIACKPTCPTLTCVIQMEPLTDEERKKVEAIGVKVFSMAEVEDMGAKNPCVHKPPRPQDIFTFCYTSGTTGDPKGVLLEHQSLVTTMAGGRARPSFRFSNKEVHLSYLPLPHIFERVIQFGMFHYGGAIGFYQGETLKILEDLQALRPTIFPSVPRLLNRIHDKLRAGVEEAGGLKKAMFDRGYAAKKAGLASGSLTHGLWDRLVFSKIKQRVGLDRVRLMITGSAPIADHVLDFLRIVFACPVLEGYGLSESCASGTLTYESDLVTGTVGAPHASNEIRLQDVPDMGYTRTDQAHKQGEVIIPCHGRGEICLRGPNIFKGYYKMPDKTAESIDSEGWFHTGDIGLWTPDGRLKIIDRKKNIFKLAQGEYVSPEKIENLNVQSKFVMQNFVYGDSLKTQLVCVCVMDPDSCAAWMQEKGVTKELPELCKDAAFKEAVLKDLQAVATRSKLSGFEVVKAVHLEPDQWMPGGEILTPSFKLQRNKAQVKYQEILDAMYVQLEAAAPPPSSKL
mmetsp:Transcript_1900/g.4273  ORF Transcript_1900/g.4273 Transcript_1900/m.4273 type:complete len:683 (+) Transcript_1900:70-2118(+)